MIFALMKALIELFGWPTVILAAGQVINFVGIGWAAVRPEAQNKQSGDLTAGTIGHLWRRFGPPGLVIAFGWLIVTVGAVWNQYEQRLAEFKETRENREWRQSQTDLITGGRSFPTVFPAAPYTDPDLFDLKVFNEGKTPSFDVAISVQNLSKMMVSMITTNEAGVNAAIEEECRPHQVGNLSGQPMRPVLLGRWRAVQTNRQVFIYHIDSRNGGGMGQLELLKKDGIWTYVSSLGFFFKDGTFTNHTKSGPVHPN